MANRLSSAQPVIIDTELSPLSDSFYLEANGQTEQWYYENTGVYAPDHTIIPLIITPHIEAKDLDTGITHIPTLYPIEWYVKEWNGSAWTRTKVTNTIDNASQPYVLVGNTLKVHKNVTAPQYGITIECEASYADPRDNAVTYPVRDSLTLTMSRDATVLYPKIQVLAESAQSFNPLKDINYGNTPATGYYDFKAEADWKGVSSDNGSLMYKADALGTEEIVSRTGTLPTTTPIIGNLRYGRGTGSTLKDNQSFMFRQTSGGTVNPVPDSIAGIEKLKGNTAVWNQLLKDNYVDLGLPSGLLWATCNIGATTQEGYGLYFSWGNVDGHAQGSGYNFSQDVYNATIGVSLAANIPVGDTYDMARHNAGLPWRLPTSSEFTELNSNCTSEWVTINGVNGRRFTSNINGNSIFFPASGYYDGITNNSVGTSGNYWSSLFVSTSDASVLTFNSSSARTPISFNRRYGFSVRSVVSTGFYTDNGHKILVKSNNAFDLTLMFGAGNEPTTVAEFEAMFPEPYYAYDAGRLLSFNPAGLKTVGFNLWDEEWEMVNGYLRSKNYIKIIPNKTYFLRDTNHVLWKAYCYDGNYNQLQTTLTNVTGGWTLGFPNNAVYAKFEMHSSYGNTYNNDICINLSDATKNGTYEAHWENTCPINITTLKGKTTGSSTDVVMFPDGLCSAGSVYDEIDLKNGRAVKRIGKVDLGSLTWYFAQASGFANRFYATLPLAKPVSSNLVIANILSEKYSIYSDAILGNVSTAPNKGIALNASRYIYARDTDYSDAATFKAAMSGVYLYYELATPIEYQFDPIPQGQWEWYGVSNGVEVRIDTLPSYVSGQGTDTLRVDALYDENMTVICRYKKYPWDTELIPQKEYRTVAWRVPNIDTIIVCKNGGSVNSASTGNYNFEVIVNANGETLSDAVIAANLRFRWKMRNSYTKQETDLGWGSQNDSSKIAIPVSSLRNATVNGEPVTTTVWCEVYMLGAYEPVTDNGVTTYQRLINNN